MAKKKKNIGDELIESLTEAVAHSRGKKKLRTHTREIPGPAPKWSAGKIRKLRKEEFNLSQPLFAALLNVSEATVRSWEQGQKSPSGAAARLLQILSVDRSAVRKLVA